MHGIVQDNEELTSGPAGRHEPGCMLDFADSDISVGPLKSNGRRDTPRVVSVLRWSNCYNDSTGLGINMKNVLKTILATGVVFTLASLSAGCAPTETTPDRIKVKANRCNAGEIWMCESKSASGISDGRHGNRDGRRSSCSCARASDLEIMIPASLHDDLF